MIGIATILFAASTITVAPDAARHAQFSDITVKQFLEECSTYNADIKSNDPSNDAYRRSRRCMSYVIVGTQENGICVHLGFTPPNVIRAGVVQWLSDRRELADRMVMDGVSKALHALYPCHS